MEGQRSGGTTSEPRAPPRGTPVLGALTDSLLQEALAQGCRGSGPCPQEALGLPWERHTEPMSPCCVTDVAAVGAPHAEGHRV